jgi:hypothetical protein
MKSAHSCRVCRRWLEGEWNWATTEERAALQRQMDQGHCDDCPPTINFIGCATVGAVLGLCAGREPLAARTVSTYLTQSTAKGGRYVNHPFPAPDGNFHGRPYWFTSRVPEIETWARTRPGQGAGGGRKKDLNESS